jgi:CRP-like cAMP-binding protein
MSSVTPRFLRNRILRSLAPIDAGALESMTERVNLTAGQFLELPNLEIDHVYFVEIGVVSILAEGPHGKTVEVGMVGLEGMTGVCAILGNGRSPYKTLVQIGGRAYRIQAAKLRHAVSEIPSLRTVILRYVQIFTEQLSSSAFANRHAKLEERLARWLFMVHQRVGFSELPLTHDSIALALGVRRAGVTDALHILEGHALIRSRRAIVVIRDSDGLRRFSTGHYATRDPAAAAWRWATEDQLEIEREGRPPSPIQSSFLLRS